MVGQVVTAKPAVGTFMMVNPVSVFGAEAEGGAAVTSADTTVEVPVYLVGPGVPRAGDRLVCRFVDYRWVAERHVPRGNTNPCRCTWPRVLTYTGGVSQAETGFYFTNVPQSAPEPPYTLTYGPLPADIPKQLQLLYFEAPGGVRDPWFITMPDYAWFSPPVPATVFGFNINVYFYLWMQACQAHVMVIDSPYGGNTYGVGQDSATKGAGNNVISYIQSQCSPQFQMKADLSLPPQITGTHGSDDIVPGPSASAGMYTNPREGL
jgi:hypothetical protein